MSLHPDVARCIEHLERMEKSAPQLGWCLQCTTEGAVVCERCQRTNWIADAIEIIAHSAAILRSYGRKVDE